MADDRQAAATLWTVECKRADDNVPSWSHGFSDDFGIRGAVVRISQKVERCAVMLDIIMLRRLPRRHIGDCPFNPGASRAKSRL